MNDNISRFVGLGLYAIPEASRLTSVPGRTIRRWICGYSYRYRGENMHSDPIWPGDIAPSDGTQALSFRDLVELRFIHAFRSAGVSWRTIRVGTEKARVLFETDHPFSTNRFRTDGRELFAELGTTEHESSLLEITKSQHVFAQLISPFFKELDFSDQDEPLRWWPVAGRRRVVLDPERQFGQPIVSQEGVPTQSIAMAYSRSQSVPEVADWYEISRQSVRAAVAFEKQLVA